MSVDVNIIPFELVRFGITVSVLQPRIQISSFLQSSIFFFAEIQNPKFDFSN